uniref:IS200/IS605 family transposase n=1 Tax=Streptococcus pluranimalium TaxID=82348 RepID=UPI003F693E89
MLKKKRTSVTDFEFSLVLVTKHRQDVFTTVERRDSIRAIIEKIAQNKEVNIIRIKVNRDNIQLNIAFPPKLAPSSVVKSLKGTSAREWFKQYPESKSLLSKGQLWTNSFYMATIGMGYQEQINRYIDDQLTESGQRKVFFPSIATEAFSYNEFLGVNSWGFNDLMVSSQHLHSEFTNAITYAARIILRNLTANKDKNEFVEENQNHLDLMVVQVNKELLDGAIGILKGVLYQHDEFLTVITETEVTLPSQGVVVICLPEEADKRQEVLYNFNNSFNALLMTERGAYIENRKVAIYSLSSNYKDLLSYHLQFDLRGTTLPAVDVGLRHGVNMFDFLELTREVFQDNIEDIDRYTAFKYAHRRNWIDDKYEEF